MLSELKKYHKYDKPKTESPYTKKYIENFVDYYVGISVPDLRVLAKKFNKKIKKTELTELLESKIHEYRLLALLILNLRMKNADLNQQKEIVDYYIDNIKHVNNWDLVDVSSYSILGKHLYNIQNYDLLYDFSLSEDLWIKRISIVSTYYLIKKGELSVPLDIIDNLLKDKHDLIHKANGWMLRNVGDKDRKLLTNYIIENYSKIPRTTLRYAIEHYPENIRKSILRGDFTWK